MASFHSVLTCHAATSHCAVGARSVQRHGCMDCLRAVEGLCHASAPATTGAGLSVDTSGVRQCRWNALAQAQSCDKDSVPYQSNIFNPSAPLLGLTSSTAA